MQQITTTRSDESVAKAAPTRARRWRRRALALSAGLLVAVPAATAGTAAAAPNPAAPAAAPAALKYIDSYFWHSDCIAAGDNGLRTGAWTYYECDNGSWDS
ncbi:MAG TPA: hypothetical protein VHW26_08430, partial [Solirubrobacteraceae bacterium]|nr:hypothetical protein [Solirubrobacteraceae bacterium]